MVEWESYPIPDYSSVYQLKQNEQFCGPHIKSGIQLLILLSIWIPRRRLHPKSNFLSQNALHLQHFFPSSRPSPSSPVAFCSSAASSRSTTLKSSMSSSIGFGIAKSTKKWQAYPKQKSNLKKI